MLAFLVLVQVASACPCKLQALNGTTEWYCFPKNCSEAGNLELKGSNASRVVLNGVSSITSLSLVGNSKLTLVSLGDTIKSIGKFFVTGSPILVGVHAPNLASAESIEVDAQDVSFPALSKVTDFKLVASSATVLKLPALATAATIHIANNSKLGGAITLPALTKIDTIFAVDSNKMVTGIHFGKAANIASLEVLGNEKLEGIAIDGNPVIEKLRVAKNTALTMISANNVTQCGSIDIGFNDKLATVHLSSLKTVKEIHIQGLVSTPQPGCVSLNCFDKADDFAVFWCSHVNKTAPLCSAKASWNCHCH